MARKWCWVFVALASIGAVATAQDAEKPHAEQDAPARRERPVGLENTVVTPYLEREIPPWYITRKKELANRPLFCEQAFGEAFDRDNLERLRRYETPLDRKLERTLAMLIRFQDLRRPERAS